MCKYFNRFFSQIFYRITFAMSSQICCVLHFKFKALYVLALLSIKTWDYI